MNVESRAADWCVINFKIARVNDDADGCAYSQRHAVNRTVRHWNHFNFEWTDFDTPAGNHFAQRRRIEQTGFSDALFYQRQREPRSVNGNVQIAQNVRQRADVIFVAVSQNDGPYVLAILLQIGDVWNDQIDAQQFGLWKHHTGIDHDDVVAVAKRHHVHAELTETAEGNCEKRLQRLTQRNIAPLGAWEEYHNGSRWLASGGRRSKNAHLRPGLCYGRELPLKRCAIATRITAPRVAAAREKRNPPPKIPSLVNTQPPMKEQIKPRMISVMQPKPRPRASLPASQPAIRPSKSQAIIPRGHHSITTVLCARRVRKASMRAPGLISRAGESVAKTKRDSSLGPPAAGRLGMTELEAGGQLLRHAVYCAEAEHQVAAINRDEFAAGEKSCKSVEGDAVVGIIEYRNEYNFVRDIKVGVTAREPLVVEENRRGRRQRFNAQRFAALVFCRFQKREIFLQCGIVGVGFIFFNNRDHGCGIYEAGEIIHMAVRVVAGDPVFQPNDVRHAEIIAENCLVIVFSEAGIALLNFALQTFFRR